MTDGARRMDRLSTQQVFRLIDEVAATGARSISLTGGEPLLRPDALRVAAYAAGKLHTMISTNGTLLTEQTAQTLANLGVPVQVSLDGATAATHDHIRGTGAFERAWRGIDLLLRSGIGERLALCMTLMQWNLHQVPVVVDLVEARGVAGLRVLPLQRLGRAAERWSELGVSATDYARMYDYLYREVPRSDRKMVQARVPPDILEALQPTDPSGLRPSGRSLDPRWLTSLEKRVLKRRQGSTKVPHGFVRMLSAQGAFNKLRVLRHILFPLPSAIAQAHGVSLTSRKVYWYYVTRPFHLLSRWGGLLLRFLTRERWECSLQ